MSKITPFKAVRPVADKVGLVTCRAYDDYSPAELAAWLDFNPYSFLHVLNPAYVNAQKKGLDKRFKAVANKYEDFKNESIFLKEENPAFYLYEIRSKSNVFTGIIAGTSVDEYKNNFIKKHEDTLPYRVELFKDYLHQTGFNSEPVLITYPDSIEINTWISLKKQSDPIYDFSTTNKERHLLWKIDTQKDIDFLEGHFEDIPNLYIADGHHRSASCALLSDEYTAQKKDNLNHILSFLIAESNLKIYEFHRLITDLNGCSTETFLKAISEHFKVIHKQQELWKPQNKHEFGMYLEGNFYALFYIGGDINKKEYSVLNNLDAQILNDTILKPILGIEDVRNDERIDYLSGKQSITTIKELVDEEAFKVGFMLYPSNIEEIKQIADASLIMPPKSTYIEPKLRSGLIIYEL
ncbi:MAG: DUF1015 domain-containing protein [Flavobacterium sp.]